MALSNNRLSSGVPPHRHLLLSKLTPPPPSASQVARADLTARVTRQEGEKIVLIQAPAGFGKTTLLAEWVAASSRPVAWLSLDELESDLTAFVRAVAAAVQTVYAEAGRTTLSLFQLPELPPVGYIATTLGNELTELPGDLVLVLDDYHTIDDAERFLEALARRPGEPLTRAELFDRVWGADHPGVSNVVDVYIGYLRRKLDAPGAQGGSSRIETVRGIGYRAVAP